MTTITLTRTGNRPIRFDGEQIASASTKAGQGPAESRWWDLALYRTAAGAYVVQIVYDTLWQGDSSRSDVYSCPDAAAVVDAVRSHDHRRGIHGYHNPGERQERLLRALDAAYQAGITRLLNFAVEPEDLE